MMNSNIILNVLFFSIVIMGLLWLLKTVWVNRKKSKGKEKCKDEKGRSEADINVLQAQLKQKNNLEKIEVKFFLEEKQVVTLSETLGVVFTGEDIEGFEEATLMAIEESQHCMPTEDEYEFFLQQDMAREYQDKSLDFSQLDAYIDKMQQKFSMAKTKNKRVAVSNISNELEDIFASSQEEALRIQEELNEEFKNLL